tara:strand:- start:5210 stop:6898 length:1689 start_codon:yes stop_codon:yes gene_type:complete
MSEQTITSTPVNAPDILKNQPLSRQVDVEIESTILEPVSHNFNSATGGRTTFNLPAKGVLDCPNASIVFSLTSNEANNSTAYNFSAGGVGCINRVTARCGGLIISQVEQAGQYGWIKTNFMSQGVKEGVMDARHISSSGVELSVAQAKIANSSVTQEFHQIYNPECDQVNSFGKTNVPTGANNLHQVQISKCLSDTATRPNASPEVVVRLADLFEIFEENRLPLLAMALVQIEIDWNACGDPNLANGQTLECPVIESVILPSNANVTPVYTQNNSVTMVPPTMLLDYIHYDDAERQKIFDAVNTTGGMRLDFSEVLLTRGVNPSAFTNAVAIGGVRTTQQVQSNHILGMAGKEVKKIYVTKNYDLRSPRGNAERYADFNQVKTHRNDLLAQFKSQQMPGEFYNFFINNARVYDKDVENVMIQHDYLSQCKDNYSVPNIYYDTANYNANKMKIALDCSWVGGVRNQTINEGRTHRYLCGSQHVIGLNLDKRNNMGSVPGNGTRIGSSPLEFNYSRLAIIPGANIGADANGTADGQSAEVLLDFYIVYRRSLIIRQLGVDTSDA